MSLIDNLDAVTLLLPYVDHDAVSATKYVSKTAFKEFDDKNGIVTALEEAYISTISSHYKVKRMPTIHGTHCALRMALK